MGAGRIGSGQSWASTSDGSARSLGHSRLAARSGHGIEPVWRNTRQATRFFSGMAQTVRPAGPAPARSRGRRHAEGVQLKTWRASMKSMSFGESDIALFCWCAFRCPLGIRRARPPSRSSGQCRLPVSDRTGIGRALDARLQLGLEALDLLRGEVAPGRRRGRRASRADDGAGGPRGVVEQRSRLLTFLPATTDSRVP